LDLLDSDRSRRDNRLNLLDSNRSRRDNRLDLLDSNRSRRDNWLDLLDSERKLVYSGYNDRDGLSCRYSSLDLLEWNCLNLNSLKSRGTDGVIVSSLRFCHLGSILDLNGNVNWCLG